MPFTALYTERPDGGSDIFLIFAQRDAQTAEDVAGTREALESQGEGVLTRDFTHLLEIPERLLPAGAEPVADSPASPLADSPPALSAAAINAIHDCLRQLAESCDGARSLDGHGFNKLDAKFGRSLAQSPSLSRRQAECGQKLLRKYRKQLPEALFTLAVGKAAAYEGTTPRQWLNDKLGGSRGDNYQDGVAPGAYKLAQFREVLELAGTPALYAQENQGNDAIVHVKLFDPCGSWTWYLTEFSLIAPDGVPNLGFGLTDGHEAELGYINVAELATVKGRLGIGIEIDMHFTPCPLREVRAELHRKAERAEELTAAGIMNTNPTILATRQAAFNAQPGPRVGDFLQLPARHPKLGRLTRLTHD